MESVTHLLAAVSATLSGWRILSEPSWEMERVTVVRILNKLFRYEIEIFLCVHAACICLDFLFVSRLECVICDYNIIYDFGCYCNADMGSGLLL